MKLNALGQDAIHTLDLLDGNRTTDTELNRVADHDGRIVVTKDNDFRDSHLLRGTPRRLIQVTMGNITNADLVALFERHITAIEAAFEGADHVELTATDLVVHPRRRSGR